MILQKLLFPGNDTCPNMDMYFHKKQGVSAMKEGSLVIEPDAVMEADTYFNAFSIGKWRKYTTLNDLRIKLSVKGACDVSLCGVFINDKNVICRRMDNVVALSVVAEERQDVEVQFNLDDYKNCPLVYLQIKAKTQTTLYGGAFFTPINDNQLPHVKLAVGICTYRRESFVFKNLLAMDKAFYQTESPLKNKIDVFVSDNAGTLPVRALRSPHTFLFKNRNYGGSGGFTRCIMEVLKRKGERGYTHIVLMDDDIAFDPAILERMYAFLKMRKGGYADLAIGGAMLILNDRIRQFENGAILTYDGMLSFKNKNLNLSTVRNILVNDVQQDNNYNAWCLCCMPLSKIEKNNLPLPLFIHMDDVEYGVRNAFDFVNLNGICVWHPYGANMRNTSIVYYDVRNKLISMASLGRCDLAEYAIRWLRIFRSDIFVYNYSRTRIACRAIEDFMQGIDAFKKVDPLALNGELARYNRAWLDAPLEHIRNVTPLPEKRDLSHVRRRKILNYLLPSKMKYIVRTCDIAAADPYRAKELFILDPATGKERRYKKSLLKAVYCYVQCFLLEKKIKRKMKKVGLEWKARISELYKWDFWKNYLGI